MELTKVESSDQEGKDTQVSFNTCTHTDKNISFHANTLFCGNTLKIAFYAHLHLDIFTLDFRKYN